MKSALRNLKSAIVAGAILFALCAAVEAQQPRKIYRIGYLANAAGIASREDAASSVIPEARFACNMFGP